MTVKLECDRCGNQERTSGVMLFAGLTGPAIPTARPELPDGWTRPRLPHEDGSAWDHELCPECKADLIRFMAGAVLAPDVADECPGCGHVHVGTVCRELTMPGAPGGVDECGCTESVPKATCPTCGPTVLEPHPSRPTVQRCGNCKEHLTPDLGTGAAPDQTCPGCGHLRHSRKCSDPVSETGTCGCLNLTPATELKELGIDD